MLDEIKAHLSAADLDIRQSKNRLTATGISPRFMDQKVTPDNLNLIARTLMYDHEQGRTSHTVRSLWDSDHLASEIRDIYSKPAVNEETAKLEYDKVIGQPLKTLAFANILQDRLERKLLTYEISQFEILKYIARDERQSYRFLLHYLKEVLSQSNMNQMFDAFFASQQSAADFKLLKTSFERDLIANTMINSRTEVRRIFPKVLNILSVHSGSKGSIRGRVSSNRFMYSELMYNRPNWRDTDKAKNITRQQHAAHQASLVETRTTTFVKREMDAVRKRHKGRSEVPDQHSRELATQVHHIFPRSTFPELADVRENLITLTPTQHYGFAHPLNDTRNVDFDYQIECLLSKVDSVEQSILSGDQFYSLPSLVATINTGYGLNIPRTINTGTLRLLLRDYRDNR